MDNINAKVSMDSEASSVGNVFLLMEDVFAEHSGMINKDIAVQYMTVGVQNTEYQEELAKWKTDGKEIATAGRGALESGPVTCTKAGMGLGIAAVVAAIASVATALAIVGSATVLAFGMGAVMFVEAAALMAVVYSIVRAAQENANETKEDSNYWGLAKEGPSYHKFKQVAYTEAQTKATQDQQAVQNTQQQINQTFQEFISPDQSTKTQDANMVNAALRWLASVVGQWRAA